MANVVTSMLWFGPAVVALVLLVGGISSVIWGICRALYEAFMSVFCQWEEDEEENKHPKKIKRKHDYYNIV